MIVQCPRCGLIFESDQAEEVICPDCETTFIVDRAND